MEKIETPNIKILVCCHKPGVWPNDDIYMPIHCGKAISNVDLGIQGDDTGDNISHKNPYYCELTAMYWAWKNLTEVDYIGLCHYRRFFDFSKYQEANLQSIFKAKDIVLIKAGYWDRCNALILQQCIGQENFYLFLSVLDRLYPDYMPTTINYLYNSNHHVGLNMFLCSKGTFDKYASWLFSILFELESCIKPSNYSRQNRTLAYLGEFLLPIYMKNQKMRIKNIPIKFTENRICDKNIFNNIFRNIANYLAFNIVNFEKVKKVVIPQDVRAGLLKDGCFIQKDIFR